MAWIDIIAESGVRFYSLTDSIETLHDMFFSFWTSATPGMILLMFVIFVSLIAIITVTSIYLAVKNGDVIST